MKLAKVACLGLVLSTGCSAVMRRAAVHGERALRAGNEEWDVHVDDVLLGCMETTKNTSEWDVCVGPTRDLDEKIGEAITAAVAALRIFWAATAAGDRPGALDALQDVRRAVEALPDEYFAGLKRMVRGAVFSFRG